VGDTHLGELTVALGGGGQVVLPGVDDGLHDGGGRAVHRVPPMVADRACAQVLGHQGGGRVEAVDVVTEPGLVPAIDGNGNEGDWPVVTQPSL
jgi:hypothetical protein